MIQFVFFILPLFVFESAWVIRNKVSTGKVILLQSSFGWGDADDAYSIDKAYKPSMLSLRGLIACWGGDNVHFYPGSDMSYFTMRDDPGSFFPFRPEIFSEQIQPDTLVHLRSLVQTSFNKDLELSERIKADKSLKAKTERLTDEFRASRPLYYFGMASIYKLKNLCLQNVVGNWPGPSFSASSIPYKTFKLAALFVYFAGILLGIISCIWLVMRKNTSVIFHLLWMSTVLLIFSFCFLINTAEFKYFMTGAVNLSLIALVGLAELLSLQRRKRTESI